MISWKSILIAFLCSITLVFAVFAQNPVTFQVNMNVQEFLGNFNTGSGDIVVVRGSFNDWSGTEDQCTLSDTLYECTVDLDASYVGTTIEYKFVIVPGGGGDDVWESVPNRTHEVQSGAQTIDPVYFNDMGWEFTDIEVLFRVDMSVQILS
jgi:hypothetical protein